MYENERFVIGPGVERAVRGRPYERKPDDPLYRPLRIFVLDPAASQLEGSTTTVTIPYEPLEPGFRGSVFEVDSRDEGTGKGYRTLDLDDRKNLLTDGRNPSPADPLFHQQMVYAVASSIYSVARKALGRPPAWGFTRAGDRLRLRPYPFCEENAYYDKDKGEVSFGYYPARPGSIGRNLPGGIVFTSLSHDIVVHEITHAILDGLRSCFALPTGPDVRGFREGFADIVAILQRFSYQTVVEEAIRRARGDLREAGILYTLAAQFGQTVEGKMGIRSAVERGMVRKYDSALPEHELGSVLVSAIFDALATIYARRTSRYLRLATAGSGILPPGEIHPDLLSLLAGEASKVASHFLCICIRAIDYCPPVDIEFGEYLRAVITADHDLIPDDRLGYREALIDAFGNRGIFPRNVKFLSEDALLWETPHPPVPTIKALSFAELRFEGDPSCPANRDELRRQARALGKAVTDPASLEQFGLVQQSDPRLQGDTVELPQIQSIRSSSRIGPDGQTVFDLVAEVTQVRNVGGKDGESPLIFLGGSTVILGPRGEVRYVVSKSILNQDRLERQREFMRGGGKTFWKDGECTAFHAKNPPS